jgi:peptide/nickel transport system substrate-binding protein
MRVSATSPTCARCCAATPAGGAGRPPQRQPGAATYVTIKSDATRLAALASGEVDLVLDPPYQDIQRLKADPRITLLQVADIGQQYLAFDQARDELTDSSDVKGRNPFKDLRVRQAVYHALNVPLIIDKVLRGQAQPTGGFLSPLVDGSPAELDKRLPYDPARARASCWPRPGYPKGFPSRWTASTWPGARTSARPWPRC